MGTPETRYLRSEGVAIAYQTFGQGPRDVVVVCDASGPCDMLWEDPIASHGLRRLEAHGRVVVFDLRGMGSSSALHSAQLPPLQEWIDDLSRLLTEIGSRRAVLLAHGAATAVPMLFAASYPRSVEALVLLAPFARMIRGDGYPHGSPREEFDARMRLMSEHWGSAFVQQIAAPSRAADPSYLRWATRAQRLGCSPVNVQLAAPSFYGADLRGVVPSIQAPVLVLARTGDEVIPVEHARYLAENLPDARLVELPGSDHFWYSGDTDAVLRQIDRFLAGTTLAAPSQRVLATVLFTDIVASTARAEAVGDAAWRRLLGRHDEVVRSHVAAFGGRFVKSTGDGALASFDAPARAVFCADGVRSALADDGLEVRSGLHTGEIELLADDDIGGLAVHLASRVCGLAEPGEILVSSSLPPLVVGSSLKFETRGEHPLKGIAGTWSLHRVSAL